MNILNKQIDSIYDRQKNLYSKYPHYSQQNAESKKVCEQEKITATSGKDVLGITKGDKENSYIVHFSDSAMVSRAVARGYVTVNGKEVELTEDTKQQLLKTDKEASAAREKAYQDWLIVSRNSIKCTLCQGHYDFFLFRFLFYICLLCRGINMMPLIDCFHLLL